MKKLLDKPLHLLTVFILILVGGLYWYSGSQQEHYDASASAYLRSALADISSWDSAALRRQLAPEASAAIDDAQMQALVARYRELGAFVDATDLQFGRLAAALSLLGGHTLLSYSGQARFRNGATPFTATLVHRDGQFRLYNLNFGELQMRAEPSQPAQ